MLTTYHFSLSGIRCGGCIQKVNRTLTTLFASLKETHALDMEHHIDFPGVSPYKMTVTVSFYQELEINVASLICEALAKKAVTCVDDTVYEVVAPEVIEATVASLDASPVSRPMSLSFRQRFKKRLRSPWVLGLIGTGAGLALMVATMMLGPLPLVAMIAIGAISVALTLYLGAESYKEAYRKLVKARSLTMDTLFAISTLTAIVVSVASFFFPWLPMMFDAGLMIFGFRYIGSAINDSIMEAVVSSVAFQDALPKTVSMVDGVEKELKLVQPGDVLLIYPGEIIPVNGVADMDESGVAIIADQSFGDHEPRPLKPEECLLSGWYLAHGSPPLRLKATATVAQSCLAERDKRRMDAMQTKAPLETAAARALHYFIPIVLVLAVVSAILIGHFFSLGLALSCAVAVLVSACPCTLGLITPLAVKIGIKKAAIHGVQFKTAEALQAASQVDWVVFDYNGTLTLGTPVVKSHGVAMAGWSANEILTYAALIEEPASHFYAKAICEHAKAAGIAPSERLVMVNHALMPFGVKAEIDGVPYILGNQQMMNHAGIDTAALKKRLSLTPGDSVVYLVRDGQLIGYLILNDPLRPDACYAMDALRKMGKKIAICSGGDVATVGHAAQSLGISSEHVFANRVGDAREFEPNHHGALQDKTGCLQTLSKGGQRVAMIGDGGNDALVMSTCHFSLAVQSHYANPVTLDTAGATIQSGSLIPVVNAFAVSKETVGNIKQNLLISLSYNMGTLMLAGGLLLVVGMTLNPAIGVALMALQTGLILASVYYFKKRVLPHLKHAPKESAPVVRSSHQILQENGLIPGHELQSAPVEEADLSAYPPMIRPSPVIQPDCFGTVLCTARL